MTSPATPQDRRQAPEAGLLSFYESPIPIRPATLGDAIASEWTKLRSVRATVWTLGVMVALMLTLGVGTALLLAANDTNLAGEPALALGLFGVLLGSLCVITLGVLTIGSEYSTGMIRTTLTACPSRARVLAAKAIVFFSLVFVITTVTATVVAVFQTVILSGTVAASGGAWALATVGVGLYIAGLGLLSLGVGAIVRHTAGAITIMIGVVLLPLVLAPFMFADALRGVQRFLVEYSIPNQLSALYGTTMTSTGPSAWEPLLVMLGLVAVALGGAVALLNRRDV
ncbi:Efflux ABC transporter, permease protein [Streptomyces globisporus]|uniref:Efflux ABC transporter, permease protein n=1 Tax=Streptomyces globisporus TaxID=1908 RepID=A0ABN8UX45_STRGL|nr:MULTISPECIES: ABC transporter permease subunit [Streptomyces]MBK3606522.1 ABC transporter permease subunit [Streptomyces sp. MBT54]MBK3618534.1 ABC transporter permease subunit [Streptomyces sp. MBT98]MBK6046303.1 ABC transporter permease subunit [Streptomyces sp. MBT55]CAH9413441.1 Efflux ABC transporter, permease protein [Streptomyces globisporus]GGV98863.1 ABC transporter [Streptomyces globisporus]